jgi:hypothetical protein
MDKVYTIPKGKHHSGYIFKPHIKKRFLEHQIRFDNTSTYFFSDEDQYDINKLFGLSFGLHHNNSIRFGWRSTGGYSNQVEILSYTYKDGKNIKDYEDDLLITFVDIDKFYTYRIFIDDYSYTLTILDDNKIKGRKVIQHNNLPFWGYHLYPYFGGNKKAPHDINLHFKN